MTRDVLIAEIPQVLRSDLYALAALAGAVIVVIGHFIGLSYGASLCRATFVPPFVSRPFDMGGGCLPRNYPHRYARTSTQRTRKT